MPPVASLDNFRLGTARFRTQAHRERQLYQPLLYLLHPPDASTLNDHQPRPLPTLFYPNTLISALTMLFVSKSLLLTLALFVGQALSSPTPDSGPSATITAAPSAPTGCDTGSTALCCQKFSTASDPVVGLLLQLLGIVVTDTHVTVGVTCTDIDNARGGVNIWCVSVEHGLFFLLPFRAHPKSYSS